MKFDFLKVIREPGPKSLAIHLAVILVIGISLVLLFFFVYLPKITNQDEAMTVPDLEGMHFDQLEEFLEKRGLRYEVADSGYSSVYPPLTVLEQYPDAGSLVKENRKIYVHIKAKEPQKVKMPNLIDGSLKNAELILKSYGLKRGLITYKPDLAQNAILEQWHSGEKIEVGTPVAKGSTIDLVVGDGYGNRQFQIGNYVGRNIDDIEFAVTGQGLNIGSVMIEIVDETDYLDISLIDQESDSLQLMESGMVIRQNPPAGSTVRLGDIVDLWVGALSEEDSLMIIEKRKYPDLTEEEILGRLNNENPE